MMHYGFFGGWGVIGILFWVLVIIIVVWLIREFAYRQHGGNWHQSYRNNNGLDILNQRYAKGEITREEYEQKKKDILSGGN